MLKNVATLLDSRANAEQYKTKSYVNNSFFPAGFGHSWTFFILHLRVSCSELLNSFPKQVICKSSIDDCVRKQIKLKHVFFFPVPLTFKKNAVQREATHCEK